MPLVGYYISKYMAYKAFLTLFMADLKSEIKNDRMQVNFICYTFNVKKEIITRHVKLILKNIIYLFI